MVTSLSSRTWALSCVATGLVAAVLISLGMSNNNCVGVFMALGVAVVFGWVAALATRFVTDSLPSVPRRSAIGRSPYATSRARETMARQEAEAWPTNSQVSASWGQHGVQ